MSVLSFTKPHHLMDWISRAPGNSSVPRTLSFVLILILAAVALDETAAPVLFSTAPLVAVLACLLLVLRYPPSSISMRDQALAPFALARSRVLLFVAAHLGLIALARAAEPAWAAYSGAYTMGGWLFLLAKMSMLAPALVLLRWRTWRTLAFSYAAEFAAAALVLVTFFPRRAMEGLWPWYGQFVAAGAHFFAAPFVPHLGLVQGFYPTLSGSTLDVTILLSCSGINGIELFDVLFAVVVFCDWPRLNKRRALAVYFLGLGLMVFGNILRIASFAVLGNHGFPDFVARHHINAGWLFFSAMFLLLLCCTYRWMLSPSERPSRPLMHNSSAVIDLAAL